MQKRPSITVIQLVNKEKDGLAPLQIVVTYNYTRARVMAGCSMPVKGYTQAKATKAFPMLRNAIASIEGNIDALIDQGLPFTAKDCLRPSAARKTGFSQVLRLLEQRRKLSYGGMKKYRQTMNRFVEYFGSEELDGIRLSQIQGWARVMGKAGLSPTTIWGALSCMRSVYRFAVDEGILKSNTMEGWSFRRDGFKPVENPRALTEEEIEGLWKAYDETKSEPLMLFLAALTFNGLALTDMMSYDWKSVKEHNGYYKGDILFRKKTRQKVLVQAPIRERSTMILKAVQEFDFSKRKIGRLTTWVNQELKQFGDFTFYSARHTYATQLLMSNVPMNAIATLLGRNINGLAVYLKTVSDADVLDRYLQGAVAIDKIKL